MGIDLLEHAAGAKNLLKVIENEPIFFWKYESMFYNLNIKIGYWFLGKIKAIENVFKRF